MITIPPLYGHAYDRITNHSYYVLSLLSIFFLIEIGFFITWPIVGYDTDLWYHLAGGKYFQQHGTIAGNAFFSYITPPISWYNYYWLFQAVIYKVFQWAGYHGLVVFRCFIAFLTTLFICLFFVRRNENRTGLLIGVSLFIAFSIALTHRELVVRPHLFSYLFIVVFLYILEWRRDKIWILPFLGVLWCNLHGIEYPVMILIVLAYLAEMYYREWKKAAPAPGDGKRSRWIMIFTIYTIFFTPGIVALIKVPFDAAMYQHLYVAELLPLQFNSIFSFSLLPFSNLTTSFQRGLIILSFCSIPLCLYRKRLRISHLILFLASIVLLIKHGRFVYEFLLLSIPLIHSALAPARQPLENKRGIFHKTAPILMIIVVIVIPSLTYSSHFRNRPEYPFTRMNLPTGVAKFMNGLDVGGRILNEANTGGYLQWALNEKYKIFMDMEMSLFSDQDFAYMSNALTNENTFRSFVLKYDPSFVSVSINRGYFKGLIAKFSQFRPVFFDDTEVLYVNTKHFPNIVSAYEMKYIDPFQISNINYYAAETREKLALVFTEAQRLREHYPEGRNANMILANILLADNHYEKTLPYAEEIIRRYPEMAIGYGLKAGALTGLGRFEEAIADYNRAIERGLTTETNAGSVYRNLHACYLGLKEYKKAYKMLSKFVNPFNNTADYKDIYQLALSAATAGKMKDAITFLRIAEMKLPPNDADYTKKIHDNLLLFDPEWKRIDKGQEISEQR